MSNSALSLGIKIGKPVFRVLAVIVVLAGIPTAQASGWLPGKAVESPIADRIITPSDLQCEDKERHTTDGGALSVNGNGGGFRWQGEVAAPGEYQVWVTYFCSGRNAEARLEFNGDKKNKPLLNISADSIRKFFDDDGEPVPDKNEPYYFRHYWGNYQIDRKVAIEMTFSSSNPVAVKNVQLVRVREFKEALEPLLFSAIDFYYRMREPDGLVHDAYYQGFESERASMANCGIAMMAYAINYELGRDPKAGDKVLNLLRACNGKLSGVKPERHSSGFFMHFIDVKTGEGYSEYSTIDTSILVSGALCARNVFDDPRIRAEADELWNSIDWDAAVARPDSSSPRFYQTGRQMDGVDGGTLSMFNEYILLAWFCQHYEDETRGDDARENIMPDLAQLPKAVYRNRVLLQDQHKGLTPSFLVQFPFYMSDLCGNELYFSYAAAQGVADRETGIARNGIRTGWGTGPGSTPLRRYSVDAIAKNSENVASPRIIAGFIPVLPVAAEDLYLRWKDRRNRMETDFGMVLPRFVPGDGWKPYRLAGVDFSCLLFGLAAHHPEVGLDFFKRNLKFSFNTEN